MATVNSGEFGGNSQAGNLAWQIIDPLGISRKEPTRYATVSSSKYTDEQQGLLKNIISRLSKQYSQGTTPYSGNLYADTDALNDVFSRYSGYYSSDNPTNVLRNRTLTDLLSGKTGTAEALTENYKKNIEEPLLKAYKEEIMPSLQGTFAKKGLSFGSTKQQAAVDEAQTLMDSLAKGRAQLGADITKQTTDNQMSALNTSLSEILGMTQAGTTLGSALTNASQINNEAAYKEWLRQQPGGSQIDQYIMQILGLYPNYQDQVVTNSNDNSGGGLGGILSAIM